MLYANICNSRKYKPLIAYVNVMKKKVIVNMTFYNVDVMLIIMEIQK